MIWLSFDTWSSRHGRLLTWRRIYRKGKWTPFCRIEKRYDSWFGYWKESCKEPDWKISIPDGHGNTASVTYKGTPLKVIAVDLRLRANEPAFLTLEVWAQHLEVVVGALDIEINIVPEEAG